MSHNSPLSNPSNTEIFSHTHKNRDRKMEDMCSLWSYQENIDELKHKLLYTTLELDAIRMEANKEMIKNEENVKNLHNLLKIAYQERDEAKTQLQKLLNKLLPSSPPALLTTMPHLFQPEIPIVGPTKANSSIAESNSLSDACNSNHNSYGSSPVDSFFDAVSSPELSAINMADSSNMAFVNRPLVQGYNNGGSKQTQKIDHDQASVLLNNLSKGKALPKKGKLLQAVMESGPLLQTLLVAGPLPRWRNPPPLQHFKIPPVPFGGCETAAMSQKHPAHPTNNVVVQRLVNSSPNVEMSCGSSQMISTPMLNFAGGPPRSCLSDGRQFSSGIGKKHRLH